MTGEVDEAGRALVVLSVRSGARQGSKDVSAWIDTAFTGELVIPRQTVASLGLQQSAAIAAKLADGSQVVLESYTCVVDWFGSERVVEVIENDGEFALLGVGLLQGRRLEIDYRTRKLRMD